MSNTDHPKAPPFEALAVVVICFGWFILGSIQAVACGFPKSGGGAFNDSAFVHLITMEAVFASVALLLLRLRGYSIGSLFPAPSWYGCMQGVVLLVVGTLAWWVIAHALPRDELARQPITEMALASRVSLPVVIALSMVNGLYEEAFLLGYLMRGFRNSGASFAIGLSLLVRVLYHLYQGPLGAISVLVFGLVLSLFYWRTQRLWPAVFAHTLADAFAFA